MFKSLLPGKLSYQMTWCVHEEKKVHQRLWGFLDFTILAFKNKQHWISKRNWDLLFHISYTNEMNTAHFLYHISLPDSARREPVPEN